MTEAPKRATSAYMYFCQEARQSVRARFPDAPFAELGKKLAEAWKELPEEDKLKYQQMAQEDKLRYMNAMQDYRTKPSEQAASDNDSDDSDEDKPKIKMMKQKAPKQHNVASSVFMFGHQVRLDESDDSEDELYDEKDAEADEISGEEESIDSDDSEEENKKESESDSDSETESDEEGSESCSTESESDSDEEDVKKKKAKRPGREPGAPRRSMPPYLFFVTAERENLRRQHPEMKLTDIIRQLAETWKGLSEEQKKPYELKAQEDKERYVKELEAWNKAKEQQPQQKSKKEEAKPKAKIAKKKPTSKAKEKKAPNVKRPLSAFMYFCNLNREAVKRQLPEGFGFGELTKALGEQWKSLSEEEKLKYTKMAEEDRLRYEREVKMAEESKEASSDSDNDNEVKKKPTKKKATWPEKKKKAAEQKEKKKYTTKKKKEETKPIKKRPTRDPNAPKRPKTAYIFYSAAKREDVKRENPSFHFAAIGQKVGEMWKAASEEEKAPYHVMAAADKERYQKELADYEAKKN